jgi:hypothetical protein
MTRIAIINESTVVPDADLAAALMGFQDQIAEDVSPAWNVSAGLYIAKPREAAPDDWQMALLDDSDQAGALGYHDLTGSGQPLGKVFAKTDLQYNCDWHVTMSHELIEIIVDPTISRLATSPDGTRQYAVEPGDPVEDDQFSYVKSSIKVSNFALPPWYGLPGGTNYDFLAKVAAPFQIISGGYAAYLDMASGQWQQDMLGMATHRNGAFAYRMKSRFQMRLHPRNTWKRSTR